MAQDSYLTVTQLTTYLKRKFDYDPYLQRVYLTGEISNLRIRPNNHQYFSLKDDHTKINAIMFKSFFQKLKFTPEAGMKVQVIGRISLYEATGNYQIYIEQMEPDGVGALYQAYEQLKQKLNAEGLFEINQRQLPQYPKRIAVITSQSGAVIRDIVTTTHRRNPKVQLVLFPAVVQGDNAASSLVSCLEQVYQLGGFDTIIIGRGGGSIEDLWPFNEEVVARAMARSQIPIISSVGHETDTTIADLVADVRAATPTAAAELATSEIAVTLTNLRQSTLRLEHAFSKLCQLARQNLNAQKHSFLFQHPEQLYQGYSQQLDLLQQRLFQVVQQLLQEKKQQVLKSSQQLEHTNPSQLVRTELVQVTNLSQRLQRAIQQYMHQKQQLVQQKVVNLDQLSPLKTLGRGYAYTSSVDARAMVKVEDFELGQLFQVHLQNGKVIAKVIEKENNNGSQK